MLPSRCMPQPIIDSYPPFHIGSFMCRLSRPPCPRLVTLFLIRMAYQLLLLLKLFILNLLLWYVTCWPYLFITQFHETHPTILYVKEEGILHREVYHLRNWITFRRRDNAILLYYDRWFISLNPQRPAFINCIETLPNCTRRGTVQGYSQIALRT